MNIWSSYRNFARNKLESEFKPGLKDLKYYRDRLFTNVLIFLGPLSILAYIPGIFMAIKTASWGIAVVDSLAFFSLWVLIISGKLKLKIRKLIFILIFYILSIGLTVYLGFQGPGLLYLLATSIWASIIIEKPFGLISAFANLGIYLIFILAFEFSDSKLVFFNDYDTLTWSVIGINLVIINFALVFLADNILGNLEERILAENNLRKEIEIENIKLIAAKEKAEESDKLKSAFLANMSHEIRTPMNAIVGFSDLLSKTGLSEQKRKRFQQIISQNADLLLSILTDIIEISKIDSGIARIKSEKTDLVNLIDDVYRCLANDCPEHLEFSRKIVIGEGERVVLADRNKITQILNNLIVNAFKYTPTGSVSLELHKTGGNYIFIVSDTGIGIRKEHQDRIFERFYQAQEEYPGVGLGLSIVSSLSEMMGGRIRVDSEPGKGSVFSVIFSEKSFNFQG